MRALAKPPVGYPPYTTDGIRVPTVGPPDPTVGIGEKKSILANRKSLLTNRPSLNNHLEIASYETELDP
jgi:hypothetical protein